MKEKHPKGIAILFFTEMWERFSYYGMRALLMLYLIKHLKFTEELSGSIYGAYTGFVYFTPAIGGYIADRYIGYKRAILLGGFLMMLGHISLAFDNLFNFFMGLSLLILGNGFFKPNISTLLGFLYKDKPEMKDSGFTIFYMGINIGGMFGPLFCGYLGEVYSWHLGFGLAGLGMFIGLLVFYFGKNHLDFREENLDSKKINSIEPLNLFERDRVYAICILSVFSLFFWFAFEQAGSSISIFADAYTNREVNLELFNNQKSFSIPASIFQALNGFMIILFAPIFSILWTYLSKKKIEIYTGLQFFAAFIFLTIGFYILVLGSKNIQVEKANMSFIILAFFFHTIGELCISPVGLSTVSKLAPVRIAGLLMGFWFLSNAISHYLAGLLSGRMSMFKNLEDFFMIFVYTSIISSIVLLFSYKKIHTLMFRKGI